jgi:hypothetical protein
MSLGLTGTKGDFPKSIGAVADDGRVVRQTPKFMGTNPVFLRPLIGMGGVIGMNGAAAALDPMLAESVGTPEGVGFRRGPVHDQVLQIEREHFGLLLGLGRNQRLEGLRRHDEHQQAIAQPVDDVKIAGAIVARRDGVLKFITDVDELVQRVFLPGGEGVAPEGVPVDEELDDREIFARVTATAVFDKLSYDTQCRIAGAMVEKEIAAKAALGFALSADPNVADVVIKRGYDDRLGARPMRDATELLVRNALTEDLFNGGKGAGRLSAHPSGTKLQLRRITRAVA